MAKLETILCKQYVAIIENIYRHANKYALAL